MEPALRSSEADTSLSDPILIRAYEALRQGRTERAEQAYRRILQQNPEDTDATLGLAVSALRRGASEEAATYFRQTLTADPRNAVALAGMVALTKSGDPVAVESEMKTLLADQPDAGALHFVLGNTLARQERWAEAQEAYFRAHRADPGNPDYTFNLAVGLDHLHHPRLARRYYELALHQVQTEGRAAFAVERVKHRLDELQSETPDD